MASNRSQYLGEYHQLQSSHIVDPAKCVSKRAMNIACQGRIMQMQTVPTRTH